MPNIIKVLSLFDGISCAHVAIDRLGLKASYYASEVDKFAISVTQRNWPETVQLGDIRGINARGEWANERGSGHFDKVQLDLLIGGSPCQDLSVANSKREGLSGKRSGLFYEYVRLMRELQPRYFVLENVASMKAEARAEITKQMGVEPILINAALVSAQNRKRLFWTNIPGVTQPKDREILLRDILQGLPRAGKVEAALMEVRTEEAKQIRREQFKKDGRDYSPRQSKILMPRTDGKANTLLTGDEKLMLVGEVDEKYFLAQATLQSTKNWNNAQAGRVRGINGKSVTLQAGGGGTGAKTGLYTVPFKYATGEMVERVRRLTPVECERLQSVPDGYTEGLSDTQRYKTLGNAFNAEVIRHILSFMR